MVLDPLERTRRQARVELDEARRELANDPEFAGLSLSDDEWSTFHAEAAELVDRYFQLEDPATVHPIGLELKLQATVDDLVIRGVIDRLELDADGELVVTDYKTGSVPSERFEQQRLAGVHLYALLCERMLGKRPVRIQLLYLPKPEAIIARPTERSVLGAERKTKAVFHAIKQACSHDDFRPRRGALCRFCSFQQYCPAFGGDPDQASELRVIDTEETARKDGAPPLFSARELNRA